MLRLHLQLRPTTQLTCHLKQCSSHHTPPPERIRSSNTKDFKIPCMIQENSILFVVQSLNHVQVFEIKWTAACQAPLSSTISQSLLKLMFIADIYPSHPLPPPSFDFSLSQHQGLFQSWLSASNGPSIGASDSTTILAVNIQC